MVYRLHNYRVMACGLQFVIYRFTWFIVLQLVVYGLRLLGSHVYGSLITRLQVYALLFMVCDLQVFSFTVCDFVTTDYGLQGYRVTGLQGYRVTGLQGYKFTDLWLTVYGSRFTGLPVYGLWFTVCIISLQLYMSS